LFQVSTGDACVLQANASFDNESFAFDPLSTGIALLRDGLYRQR